MFMPASGKLDEGQTEKKLSSCHACTVFRVVL